MNGITCIYICFYFKKMTLLFLSRINGSESQVENELWAKIEMH